MKTPHRILASPHDAVDLALASHVASTNDPAFVASPALRARCRAAAAAGLELAKLRAQRTTLAAEPASLREHFDLLARRSRVKLGRLFEQLGLGSPAAGIEGLGQLAIFARRLGLELDEVIRRVRCEFAELSPAADPLAHARPRTLGSAAKRSSRAVDEALLAREAAYSTARRTELRKALATVADAYTTESR